MNRKEAIEQLSRSQRGCETMRAIREWMDKRGGVSLDAMNQTAAITLIAACFDDWFNVACMIDETLGADDEE